MTSWSASVLMGYPRSIRRKYSRKVRPAAARVRKASIIALEIYLVGMRNRKQVLAENIAVVFGAHRFQHRVGHLAPAHDHVQRFVEGVGIIDAHQRFEPAVRQYLETLGDVLLL